MEKEQDMRNHIERLVRARAAKLDLFIDDRDVADAVEQAIDMIRHGRSIGAAIYLTIEGLR